MIAQPNPPVSLPRLWLLGLTQPALAFDELRRKPAPAWGTAVVVACNLLVAFVTLPLLILLDYEPLRPPLFTFLPAERYFQAEIFFLPVVRIGLWLLSAAVVHLGLRLAARQSDFDLILNIEGMANLVVMPPLLLFDWLTILVGVYGMAVAAVAHAVAAVTSLIMCVIGLRRLMDVKLGPAIGLNVLTLILNVGVLSLVAR